jgi:tetratricopeptide (TPR) repeat protein
MRSTSLALVAAFTALLTTSSHAQGAVDAGWCFNLPYQSGLRTLDRQRVISGCTNMLRYAGMPWESRIVALLNRADAYTSLDQVANAIADYDKVVEMNPDNYNALWRRCSIRAYLGKGLDLALDDCDRAIGLNSGDVRILAARGIVFFRTDNFAAAIADEDKVLLVYPDDVYALFARGLAKLKSNDIPGGNADVAGAEKLAPRISELFAHYGMAP